MNNNNREQPHSNQHQLNPNAPFFRPPPNHHGNSPRWPGPPQQPNWSGNYQDMNQMNFQHHPNRLNLPNMTGPLPQNHQFHPNRFNHPGANISSPNTPHPNRFSNTGSFHPSPMNINRPGTPPLQMNQPRLFNQQSNQIGFQPMINQNQAQNPPNEFLQKPPATFSNQQQFQPLLDNGFPPRHPGPPGAHIPPGAHSGFLPPRQDMGAQPPFIPGQGPINDKDKHLDEKDLLKERMMKIVSNWMQNRTFNENNQTQDLLKIHEYKKAMKNLSSKIDQLRQLNDKMAGNVHCDPDQWSSLLKEVASLKADVSRVQRKLMATEQIEFIEKLIQKRKKRRERERQTRRLRAGDRIKSMSKRIQSNQEIDDWRSKETAKLQMDKMLESLRTEAGESLTEVKRKQNEASEKIIVLQRLKELRDLRKGTAIYKGILVTSKETEAFEEKINNAIELLNEQKKVYEDEEKALRVLREEEVEGFEQKEKEKRKKRKQKHEHDLNSIDPMVVFRSYWLSAEQSIPALVQIRSLWDSYLCPSLTTGSSRLPDDFPPVVPPSCDQWKRFLVQKETKRAKKT